MKFVSLQDAEAIYSCGQRCRIVRHRISCQPLRKFAISVTQLERDIGGADNEEYWSSFLRILKRIRYELSAAPLPHRYHQELFAGLGNLPQDMIGLCRLAYPGLHEITTLVVSQLEYLLAVDINPLLDKLLELVSDTTVTPDDGIVVHASRLIPPVTELITSYQDLRVLNILTSPGIQADRCFNTLFVFGPMSWYPPSIFLAPRAATIHNIAFGWTRDSWKPRPVFAGSFSIYQPRQPQVQSIEAELENGIDPESILPTLDWVSLANKAGSESQGPGIDEVSAIGFSLEGGFAVFLEDADEAKVLVIDLDSSSQEDLVKKVLVSSIVPGMFLLLRTSGGGDYLVEVADRIMGARAEEARTTQRHWKQLLRGQVEQRGISEVSISLQRLGARLASEANVRNWMSYRNIKTQKYGDFHAVMQLIGLGDRSKTYWSKMRFIDSAHRKAGMVIRRLLLQEISRADLDQLARIGRMEFHLSDQDSGSLTAFRVESVSHTSVHMPSWRLGVVVRIED